jgi:hypothetical protein
MKILPRLIASVLLSLVATSAGAVIMFSPTPSGTGNNVVFNQQPPDQTGTTVFGNISVNRHARAVYEHSGPDDSFTGSSPN